MCGVVGIWAPNGSRQSIYGQLASAVASLRHRGPDDSGIWLNDCGVGLGHTRLSIIDLSASGHQPMVSADGRYVVVFNGEIYNFAELRDELASAGHTFVGTSDTEVILHAYREWGSDAVHRFIGMFAIAIWDAQECSLELIRDRIGVKPLYFGWHDGTLCFASELRALVRFTHWQPEISSESLGEFLQYGYISADRCIYGGIQKLLPGHRLVLRRGHAPVLTRYWSVVDAVADPFDAADQFIEQRLEELLVNAFRYRMVADVPVGVFLSGGVDSSLLTALLAKHHHSTVRTFTIGFEEDTHDESQWARQVAAHCGTQHSEHILRVSEALDLARRWGSLFDEPFGDSSGIPMLLVSRIARRSVKVALSADGGDELFSGYTTYGTVLRRLETFGTIPEAVTANTSRVLLRMAQGRLYNQSRFAALLPATRGRILGKAARLGHALGAHTLSQMMNAYTSHWYPYEISRLIGHYDSPRASLAYGQGTAVDQLSLWDFHQYLPDDILTKVDRTTMSVGLEGREPLLDHRLAEFAFRLPTQLRRGSLGAKHILKSILYRHVPRALVDRPKQGFGIPLTSWLRKELRELVHDFLSAERLTRVGIMDPVMIGQIVDDFDRGNDDLTDPLWLVLAFEMWREHWQVRGH